MAEENAPVVESTEEQPQPEEKPADKFKEDPTYKAMSQQLAELQREKAVREAAEEEARREAEIKELESKGEYEAAIKARDAELENLKNQHASELQKRDLTAELLKAGFNNDMFMTGAVANYDAEKGSISEYVQGLASDESNAPFLKGSQARDPKAPPVPTAQSSSGGNLSGAQIKAMRNSDNAEDRARAIAALRKYVDANNGEFPSGYL